MPIMQKELERVNGTKLLAEIDMPLTPVLADMEMIGALIDTKFFSKMSVELALRLAEIEKEIFELAGKTIQHQFDAATFGCAFQSPASRTTRQRPQNSDGLLFHFCRCFGNVARQTSDIGMDSRTT